MDEKHIFELNEEDYLSNQVKPKEDQNLVSIEKCQSLAICEDWLLKIKNTIRVSILLVVLSAVSIEGEEPSKVSSNILKEEKKYDRLEKDKKGQKEASQIGSIKRNKYIVYKEREDLEKKYLVIDGKKVLVEENIGDKRICMQRVLYPLHPEFNNNWKTQKIAKYVYELNMRTSRIWSESGYDEKGRLIFKVSGNNKRLVKYFDDGTKEESKYREHDGKMKLERWERTKKYKNGDEYNKELKIDYYFKKKYWHESFFGDISSRKFREFHDRYIPEVFTYASIHNTMIQNLEGKILSKNYKTYIHLNKSREGRTCMSDKFYSSDGAKGENTLVFSKDDKNIYANYISTTSSRFIHKRLSFIDGKTKLMFFVYKDKQVSFNVMPVGVVDNDQNIYMYNIKVFKLYNNSNKINGHLDISYSNSVLSRLDKYIQYIDSNFFRNIVLSPASVIPDYPNNNNKGVRVSSYDFYLYNKKNSLKGRYVYNFLPGNYHYVHESYYNNRCSRRAVANKERGSIEVYNKKGEVMFQTCSERKYLKSRRDNFIKYYNKKGEVIYQYRLTKKIGKYRNDSYLKEYLSKDGNNVYKIVFHEYLGGDTTSKYLETFCDQESGKYYVLERGMYGDDKKVNGKPDMLIKMTQINNIDKYFLELCNIFADIVCNEVVSIKKSSWLVKDKLKENLVYIGYHMVKKSKKRNKVETVCDIAFCMIEAIRKGLLWFESMIEDREVLDEEIERIYKTLPSMSSIVISKNDMRNMFFEICEKKNYLEMKVIEAIFLNIFDKAYKPLNKKEFNKIMEKYKRVLK